MRMAVRGSPPTAGITQRMRAASSATTSAERASRPTTAPSWQLPCASRSGGPLPTICRVRPRRPATRLLPVPCAPPRGKRTAHATLQGRHTLCTQPPPPRQLVLSAPGTQPACHSRRPPPSRARRRAAQRGVAHAAGQPPHGQLFLQRAEHVCALQSQSGQAAAAHPAVGGEDWPGGEGAGCAGGAQWAPGRARPGGGGGAFFGPRVIPGWDVHVNIRAGAFTKQQLISCLPHKSSSSSAACPLLVPPAANAAMKYGSNTEGAALAAYTQLMPGHQARQRGQGAEPGLLPRPSLPCPAACQPRTTHPARLPACVLARTPACRSTCPCTHPPAPPTPLCLPSQRSHTRVCMGAGGAAHVCCAGAAPRPRLDGRVARRHDHRRRRRPRLGGRQERAGHCKGGR